MRKYLQEFCFIHNNAKSMKMSNPEKKRKALPNELAGSPKRQRLEEGREHSFEIDDVDSDFSEQDLALDSEDEEHTPTADTPITPFSPSRGPFPSQRKTIPCTFAGCNKMFNRPARLVSHIRSHTNERPFACTYEGCDKAYAETKHLKQHIKGTHTQEREYACDWDGCGKTFLTGTRLRRHQEAHKGHDRFRCSEYPPCNQTFRKHQTLQRHIRADHLHLTPFPCTFMDTETEVRCSAGFDSGGALRKHEDRVHGSLRFFCEECTTPGQHATEPEKPLGFRTKTELNKHMKACHLDCIFCDMNFRSQLDLERHTETAHSESTGLLPLPKVTKKPICTWDGCGKTFAKKYNLDVHVRQVHKGQRYTCGDFDLMGSTIVPNWNGSNACGQEFNAKVNLEDHVRTQHLGLASVVNSNRQRSSAGSIAATEMNEFDPIGLLTGAAYGRDVARDIPCSVAGCQWRFTREYDMEQHILTRHNCGSLDQELQNATNAALGSAFDQTQLDMSYDPNLDFDWQLQHQAANGGQFWFGGESHTNSGTTLGLNEWNEEEQEMRRLLDVHLQEGDSMFEQFVDPVLSGQ